MIKDAQILANRGWRVLVAQSTTAILYLALLCVVGKCFGQGTFTWTFEGLPRGTYQGIGSYSDSGLYFGTFGQGSSFFLSGGGVAGFPDNGTGDLVISEGNLFFQMDSGAHFDLLSFDAAWNGGLSSSLQVIGYHNMGVLVTNTFTLSGGGFQTLTLVSQFLNVYHVDVYSAHWSLDNLTLGSVPEPSASTLILLGGLSAVGWERFKKGRAAKAKSK